jgi:hypothetical protein
MIYLHQATFACFPASLRCKTIKNTNMKIRVSVIFAALFLSFTACNKDQNDSSDKNGVLKGTIGLYEGNCMPGINCEPAPISTTVAITRPSEDFNINLLVGSVITSEYGTFEIKLPEGNYSIFLRDGNKFICDSWSCPDDCYCSLITIKNDSITTITANIDHAAW